MRTIISLVQALLFIVSGFAVPDSNFKVWVDRAAMEMSSTQDLYFDSMDAKDYEITDEEKTLCRNWYEENILSTENPAYNFTVGGKISEETLMIGILQSVKKVKLVHITVEVKLHISNFITRKVTLLQL